MNQFTVFAYPDKKDENAYCLSMSTYPQREKGDELSHIILSVWLNEEQLDLLEGSIKRAKEKMHGTV